MAPEAQQKSRSKIPKADIWSIGAITYFLLTGKEPFTFNDVADITEK